MSSTVAARRVLVTGAGGFVGANLVRSLVRDGYEITAGCREGGSPWRLEGLEGDVRMVALDIRDAKQVSRVVREARPELVFHLATHGAYHWQRDAGRIFATSLLGTVNLVEACREAGAARIVNAGSSSEYGFKDHAPAEDEPLEPTSEYGVAKAAGTLYCRQAAVAGDTDIVTLRLYSAYGPFEDPARLMSALVVHGLRGELPPLVDPDTARDFVAVEDVVRAFMLAAARPLPEQGRVYNVGSGVQSSLRDVAEVARRVFGLTCEPRFGEAKSRPWDTGTWVARTGRIEGELGWRPQLDLACGVELMADWLRAEAGLWERYGVSQRALTT